MCDEAEVLGRPSAAVTARPAKVVSAAVPAVAGILWVKLVYDKESAVLLLLLLLLLGVVLVIPPSWTLLSDAACRTATGMSMGRLLVAKFCCGQDGQEARRLVVR
jgi:hypothetical protein